jgi:hypothetical protein
MGYDDLKELMDIDFPGEGLSEDEDHTATGTGGTHPSVVPMIDVAVGGWRLGQRCYISMLRPFTGDISPK